MEWLYVQLIGFVRNIVGVGKIEKYDFVLSRKAYQSKSKYIFIVKLETELIESQRGFIALCLTVISVARGL